MFLLTPRRTTVVTHVTGPEQTAQAAASLRVVQSPFKKTRRLLPTAVIFSLRVKASCCLGV